MGHNKHTTIGKKKKELDYDDRRFLDKSIDNIYRRKVTNKYSPDAVVMHFDLHGWPTETRISTKTIYRYIQKGILEGISDKNLLRQGLLQRKPEKTPPQEHKRAKTAEKSIDMIEREMGAKRFRKTFQTITADNGSEFMNIAGIERAYRTKHTQRTSIYFAHPYASSERGSNENLNGFVRRFIPKGSDIGSYSKSFIKNIEDFINNYPRRVLNGLTSAIAFDLASQNFSQLSIPKGCQLT